MYLNNKDICLVKVSNISQNILEFDSFWCLSLQDDSKDLPPPTYCAALMENNTDIKSDGFWKVPLSAFSTFGNQFKKILLLVLCLYRSFLTLELSSIKTKSHA